MRISYTFLIINMRQKDGNTLKAIFNPSTKEYMDQKESNKAMKKKAKHAEARKAQGEKYAGKK